MYSTIRLSAIVCACLFAAACDSVSDPAADLAVGTAQGQFSGVISGPLAAKAFSFPVTDLGHGFIFYDDATPDQLGLTVAGSIRHLIKGRQPFGCIVDETSNGQVVNRGFVCTEGEALITHVDASSVRGTVTFSGFRHLDGTRFPDSAFTYQGEFNAERR